MKNCLADAPPPIRRGDAHFIDPQLWLLVRVDIVHGGGEADHQAVFDGDRQMMPGVMKKLGFESFVHDVVKETLGDVIQNVAVFGLQNANRQCHFFTSIHFGWHSAGDSTARGMAQLRALELIFLQRDSMVRTASRLRPMSSILVAVLVLAAFAPGCAWAAASGASGEDAPDEASRLMVMADFNRDGIADTAEAALPAGDHSGPGVLTVMLGQADGTYKQAASHPVLGHAPRSIVAGDFNGDGIPDLIVGDDDGALMLFLGDGTGKLAPAGDVGRLDSVVSIAVADFNRDGIPDMAVSDWRASSVTVFLGAGNGAFRRESSFPLRMHGTVPHISAADFNGDGILDLAVVYDDDEGDTFDVMLGTGNGTFTEAPNLSVVKDPNSHCAT
jgi:hypothetical protein